MGSDASAKRPGFKWWALVILAVLVPPFGLLVFAADWGWRRWMGRPLIKD